MIRHCVVEVKVIDVNHEVRRSWGLYDAGPMQFLGFDIGCWYGYWSVKGKSISSHSESNSVRLFILGPNAADDAAICELGVLGHFVPVYKKASTSSLYVSNPLGKPSNLI